MGRRSGWAPWRRSTVRSSRSPCRPARWTGGASRPAGTRRRSRLAAMRSVTRAPHPALAPFVAALGYGGGEFPHDREARVPSGCLQLVVNLHEDRLRWYAGPGYRTGHHTTGAALCGATSGPVGMRTADQRRVLWVAFRPGGGYPFFAPPAAELTGPVVPLDALWGAGAGNLRERLLAAPSPAAALAVPPAVLPAPGTRPLDPGSRPGAAP